MVVRIPEKLLKAAEIYDEIIEELRRYKMVELSLAKYDIFTAPLKRAARKVGLKVSRGMICSKNNVNCFDALIFPTEAEFVPMDSPAGELCIWKETMCANVLFVGQQCRLELIDIIKNSESGIDVYRDCIQKHCPEGKRPISKEAFSNLKNAFGDSLKMMGMGETNPIYKVRGWNLDDKPRYFWETVFSNFGEPKEKNSDSSASDSAIRAVRMVEPMAKVCSSFEYVFMAATLFSICKPLFVHYNIKANLKFCLQIDIQGASESEIIQKKMLLDHFADMWCNYRDWNDRSKKNSVRAKFWNKDGISDLLFTSWNHMNFPMVFSDYSRISWDSARYCNIEAKKIGEFLGKEEVQKIGEASCLPLLLPLYKPEKSYPAKDCLRLIWNSENDMGQIGKMVDHFEPIERNKRKLSRRHREIIRFYVEFIKSLNAFICSADDKKPVTKLLRNSYKNALFDLGAIASKATVEQQERACLLSSMYIASELLKTSRYAKNISAAINDVKKYLGRDATLEDFAEFVRECLDEKSKYRKAFCFQDKDGIYLFYNGYWEEFRKFCTEKGLFINCGAAAFRRKIIEKYISPQYDPANTQKYARYDYRKIVDGQKAVVLKVSPKILKLR